MRWLGAFLLAWACGCDGLWQSSAVPNAQRCDVTASLCTGTQICNQYSGRCVEASTIPTENGLALCGTPWSTASVAPSFTPIPLTTPFAGANAVSIALGDG